MRIGAKHSHMNGEEYLHIHHPKLWCEVREVIANVDAEACRTKEYRERTMRGEMPYSPRDLSAAFKAAFESYGWQERRATSWATDDETLLRRIRHLPGKEQKKAIKDAGREPIRTHNQIDFVKRRVAVVVQFGRYEFVAHDLFVKHLGFCESGVIDVGVELLPMMALESEMASGGAYFERDLLNLLRHERGVPAVPLVLVGLAP